MDTFGALGQALIGRGYAAANAIARTSIAAVEHETVLLPRDIVLADGSLDLYDDVQRLFRPVFSKGRPAIQCAGWLGYIPLNDRYALEVNPRVPIGNLERLIGLAEGYSPETLRKYSRRFAQTSEQPAALFDVVTDQLLDAFDRVWESGLVRRYEHRRRTGTSPIGRIIPFESSWRTAKAGVPIAVSTAFHRVADFGPNRILKLALERLLARYLAAAEAASRSPRVMRIKRALERLRDVSLPTNAELSPPVIASNVWRLPLHHENYVDAVIMAQFIIFDVGLAIRASNGLAILPSILIDMSKVFEDYTRNLLADHLGLNGRVVVKDGNKGGASGAKQDFFRPIRDGLKSPPATPDIVIEVDGIPRLVIDAKYKGPMSIPDRADINQIIGYGARYNCARIMILYAGRAEAQAWVDLVGNVGSYFVFTGGIDLNAEQIEKEERYFTQAVGTLF